MSVTEFKRRNKKTYFLMGTGSALVPALIVILVISLQWYQCSQKRQLLEKELDQTTVKSGFILKQNVSKGQKIEKAMLQEVTIRAQKDKMVCSVGLKELAGKYAKCDFKKGTCLNSQCVYEETEFSDDMRIQKFDFMEINNMVQQGDYIDIRIAYPSGEDYIVARHKKVLQIQSDPNQENQMKKAEEIFLQISEEEILRIASAYVDTICYSGTKIYVVTYLDQFQQAGIVDYPVNPMVYELLGWNPNVVDYTASDQEMQQRSILEGHLSAYASQEMKELTKQTAAENEFISDTASFFE
ncbi:MAG: hypothetical protein HFI75_14735 [Lachnospiraceae bacterium]|nr:hypothetical protein [Lachnospiraceae bacterium]